MSSKRIHRLLGLYLGLIFVFMGLTGSLLVFYRDLDKALQPDLLRAPQQQGQAYVTIDRIIASARDSLPSDATLTLLTPPTHPHAGYQLKALLDDGVPVEIYLDPYTSEVIGGRKSETHLIRLFYRLHNSWLLGETGHDLVGWLGLVLLLHIVLGIVLWWPKGNARAFPLRWHGPRFLRWYDLHRLLGIIFGLILILSTLTGFAMAHQASIAKWFGVAAYPQLKRFTYHEGASPLTYEALVAASQSVFPDATLTSIRFPLKPTDPVIVSWRQPDEVRESKGMSRVWLNPYNAAILGVRDAKRLPAYYAVIEWAFPLHNGEKLGIAGRIIVFITGWAPLALLLSGVLISRSRKRKPGNK